MPRIKALAAPPSTAVFLRHLPLFFALAAGPLAMLLKRGGRVASLAAVVLPVFGAYFPLAIGGQRLAEQGAVPPWVGAWAADIVLAAAGAITLRKFVRL